MSIMFLTYHQPITWGLDWEWSLTIQNHGYHHDKPRRTQHRYKASFPEGNPGHPLRWPSEWPNLGHPSQLCSNCRLTWTSKSFFSDRFLREQKRTSNEKVKKLRKDWNQEILHKLMARAKKSIKNYSVLYAVSRVNRKLVCNGMKSALS